MGGMKIKLRLTYPTLSVPTENFKSPRILNLNMALLVIILYNKSLNMLIVCPLVQPVTMMRIDH